MDHDAGVVDEELAVGRHVPEVCQAYVDFGGPLCGGALLRGRADRGGVR